MTCDFKVLTSQNDLRMPGGAHAKPRHFLRVRNQASGEICLEWSESRDQRAMDVGDRGHEEDRLTRRLHDGGAGESGSQHGSQLGRISAYLLESARGASDIESSFTARD